MVGIKSPQSVGDPSSRKFNFVRAIVGLNNWAYQRKLLILLKGVEYGLEKVRLNNRIVIEQANKIWITCTRRRDPFLASSRASFVLSQPDRLNVSQLRVTELGCIDIGS